MNPENPALPDAVLVACLCAEWRGVGRDYADRFAQMQAKFPQARFLWIDVEDEADLLSPLDDVDDFPTLLVAVGEQPRFFGPVTPQPETLERLIRAEMGKDATALADPAVTALVARIRAATAQR